MWILEGKKTVDFMINRKIDVVLPSAGIGKRYREGFTTYKSLLKVSGKEICIYTLEVFDSISFINKLILVVPREQIKLFKEMTEKFNKPVKIIEGGKTRRESVWNGLQRVSTEKVIIHDIIRPMITKEMICRLVRALKNYDSVSTAVPVINTVVSAQESIVFERPKRENLYELQTPQAFDTRKIMDAHRRAMETGDMYTTDDTRLMDVLGFKTVLVDGDYSNIKITHETDLQCVSALVNNKKKFNVLSGLKEIESEFRHGKPIILVDSEERENEGDLLMPADLITPDIINFMLKEGRGIFCVPLTKEYADRIGVKLMHKCDDPDIPTFTVSIDSVETESGVSAYDRFLTIKKILDPQSTISDFKMPGHIFPLLARPGGLKKRQGHTEGSIELCKLLGFQPVATLCEILKENGEVARFPDLELFARKYDLKISSIKKIQERLGY